MKDMKEVKLYADDDGTVYVDGAVYPLAEWTALPVLYTEQQVAEYFGVTIYAVRDWRKRGRCKWIQIAGGKVRFTHQQLLDLITEYTEGGWAMGAPPASTPPSVPA